MRKIHPMGFMVNKGYICPVRGIRAWPNLGRDWRLYLAMPQAWRHSISKAEMTV